MLRDVHPIPCNPGSEQPGQAYAGVLREWWDCCFAACAISRRLRGLRWVPSNGRYLVSPKWVTPAVRPFSQGDSSWINTEKYEQSKAVFGQHRGSISVSCLWAIFNGICPYFIGANTNTISYLHTVSDQYTLSHIHTFCSQCSNNAYH